MTSTRKILLGTAAATIAVTGGVNTGAQAADAMLKKAPPIQYVRICDRYGYGFFQIPGSSICLQLRGQVQSDNAIQPTQDLVFVSASKKDGTYGSKTASAANGQVVFANQQDNWGYEVSAKPRFDARTETSMGTLRAYVELKMGIDAGAFNGFAGGGGGADVNKATMYRAYMQWAGWSIGYVDSPYSLGNMKDGDIANVEQSDKSSGWGVNYTWTPTGPGLPPVKGSAPVPDGWSFTVGIDTPFEHRAGGFQGGGCRYYDLQLSAASPAGFGNVCATDGPISIPDFVARIHWEGDPTGKDDQHNDQFGLGTIHLAGVYHQISQVSVGGSPDPMSFLNCGTGTCGAGVPVHDHGYAVTGFLKFFVPMFPGTTLGSRRGSDADNLQFQVDYCNGMLEGCGIGKTNGNLSTGDAYWMGGLQRDDMDSRIVNTGTGTFYNDKEKALSVIGQYHFALTNCNDPVHCLVGTLNADYTWVTPGSVTQNVDWTLGGLGKAKKFQAFAELSWGTSRNGSTKPVFWRADFEVGYMKLWQDLPNNCDGGSVCGVQTALPLGITKDPSNYVGRATITYDW